MTIERLETSLAVKANTVTSLSSIFYAELRSIQIKAGIQDRATCNTSLPSYIATEQSR